MATPRALSNLLGIPPTMRCFALSHSVRYASTNAVKPRPRPSRPAKPTGAAKPSTPAKPTTARPKAGKPTAARKPSAKPTTSKPKLAKDTKTPARPAKTTKPTPRSTKPIIINPAALSSLSFHPPPSNDPNQRALASPSPHITTLTKATRIFTAHPSRFLFSAARFLQIPSNNHTPEICLLGRSNVGKSTLINALAGMDGATAGTTHGLQARGAGLAITSKRAGSTVCMNAYGFGVPSKEQTAGYYQVAEAEAKEALKGAASRAQRREAKMFREPPPRHRLVMVDMPGYGLGSEEAWGVEIAKYLGKRKVLRGAVLLVDAVAGVKDMDRMVLEMLRDQEVRTAVVLTKMDKLAGEGDPERAEKRVEEVCLSVWEELRKVEMGGLTWLEGAEKGWETEIWATGAGDPRNGGLGVAGARWAICRMAGLVEDNRVLKVPGLVGKPVQKIVSFDQIQRLAAAPKIAGKASF